MIQYNYVILTRDPQNLKRNNAGNHAFGRDNLAAVLVTSFRIYNDMYIFFQQSRDAQNAVAIAGAVVNKATLRTTHL